MIDKLKDKSDIIDRLMQLEKNISGEGDIIAIKGILCLLISCCLSDKEGDLFLHLGEFMNHQKNYLEKELKIDNDIKNLEIKLDLKGDKK